MKDERHAVPTQALGAALFIQGFLPAFVRAFAVRTFAAACDAFVCWSSYLR